MRPLATGLMLAAVLGLAPSLTDAQPVSVSDKPGWSPEGYLLSFGVGAYRPDPGSSTFNLVYPGDSSRAPLILPQLLTRETVLEALRTVSTKKNEVAVTFSD